MLDVKIIVGVVAAVISIGLVTQAIVFDGLCPFESCYCGLDSLGKLETVCNAGGLSELPVEKMSPNIQVFRVGADTNTRKKNRIREIKRVLRLFKKIEVIEIRDSGLETLSPNSFDGLDKLRVLNLSRNNLAYVQDDFFSGLQHLRTLNLSRNKISKFGVEPFKHLTGLKNLDLSWNGIQKLPDRLFYNLVSLETLVLNGGLFGKYTSISYDNANRFNFDVFRDVWRLKTLYLEKCHFTNLDTQFFNLLPKLQKLSLKGNKISKLLPRQFQTLKNLKSLDLANNRIKTLSDYSLASLNKLDHISLSSNGLSTIAFNAFENTSTVSLDLSHNNLKRINKLIFDHMRKRLRILSLKGCRNLETSELFVLLSVNNDLEVVDFSRMRLRHLNLSKDFFEMNTKIKKLNLSNNELTSLSESWFLPFASKLEVLDLTRNQLLGIDGSVLNLFDTKLPRIRDLRLGGNPWSCDLCHVVDLVPFVRTNVFLKNACRFRNENCLKCASPRSLYGEPLETLTYNDLRWCDLTSSNLPWILIIFLILLTLITIAMLVFLGCYVTYKHTAVYYTNEDNRIINESNSMEINADTTNVRYATVFTKPKIARQDNVTIATLDDTNGASNKHSYPDVVK